MTAMTRNRLGDRIRVLEFVTSFHAGGTERQFLNLVTGLPRDRFEVHLACFRAQGRLCQEVRATTLASSPLREYSLRSLRSPAALVQLLSCARYLRRHRIQVVHTTGLYPNVFGVLAARLAGTPAIVASIRDMGHMWSASLRTLQRWTCRAADAVVTNAEAVSQRLVDEGFDRRRITVIRNGLAAASKPPGDEPAPLRAELGLPPATPLVGTVCRVDRVKNLESFLDAAALVVREHPTVRFLIIGGPQIGGEDYRAELEQRVECLGLQGRAILTGHRDDVQQLLPQLSVSVLCSHSEGLSNAILESMRAGLPVVATDVGGNPELVEPGVTGFLVPPARPDALASAIRPLLDQPALAARLGAAGRDRIDAAYSLERMVAQTSDLYLSLLEHSRRGPIAAFGASSALARQGRAR